MSSYIAICYTAWGPSFSAAATVREAQVYLSQRICQQPLRRGEAVAIVTADTDEVVYYRHASRTQVLTDALCQHWMQVKRLMTSRWAVTKPA